MLTSAYQPLFDNNVFNRDEMIQNWEHLEKLCREEVDSFFITTFNDVVVGFGSIDPRSKPEGNIGHHIILPDHQGKGFGKYQLLEMERRLKNMGCPSIKAVTGAIDFFAAARSLYEKNGYKICSKNRGKYFDTIEYINKTS